MKSLGRIRYSDDSQPIGTTTGVATRLIVFSMKQVEVEVEVEGLELGGASLEIWGASSRSCLFRVEWLG